MGRIGIYGFRRDNDAYGCNLLALRSGSFLGGVLPCVDNEFARFPEIEVQCDGFFRHKSALQHCICDLCSGHLVLAHFEAEITAYCLEGQRACKETQVFLLLARWLYEEQMHGKGWDFV